MGGCRVQVERFALGRRRTTIAWEGENRMDPNHGRLKEQACEQEVVKTSPLRDPIFFEVDS